MDDLLEFGVYTEEDLPKTWWQRVLATVNFGGVYYYASTLEEEYRVAQYGTTLYELSLEYQEKYQQQQGMLVTMALAQLGYNATSRALYGPAFNAATAYSPDSRLDQIEKTGVDPGNGSATVGRSTSGQTGYAPPVGGGGKTASIEINGQVFTFGHGGRHLEGTGLDVGRVNQAIAKQISLEPTMTVKQFRVGKIMIDGYTIRYGSMLLESGIINIGTYYIIK